MNQALTALCFSLQPTSVAKNATEQGVWLPMIPAGTFAGVDSRSWTNNNPEQVIARFTQKRPFDIEHSTHIKAPKGEPAPAYGWITKAENRDGVIWGFIEWNDDGAQLIAEKKYAFYSPSFTYDKNGQVLALVSAALTNDPNLDVPALNNRMENANMPLPKIVLDALGLAEDATPEQAEVAINTLKQDKEVALNRASTVDLNKYIPKATHELALNRAETAETKLAAIHDKELETLVDDAIEAGKIAPANKDMYVSLCRSEGGAEQFKSFIASAPAVVDSKEKQKPDLATNSKLDEHEIAMCRKLGTSEEEYLAAKALMNKGAK
ncbi:MAG: phage protease [Vibrio sp.]|uniref:phage protease n=1 Tax=Vibrio sp. TaxID=678 RepID=UPI003A87F381